jgi:ABC-type multidrug transport system fused ATPase/permease subunit
VAQAIRAATRGRTTLVVSHDPLLVDLADRVVSIDAPASGASEPRSSSSQLGGR